MFIGRNTSLGTNPRRPIYFDQSSDQTFYTIHGMKRKSFSRSHCVGEVKKHVTDAISGNTKNPEYAANNFEGKEK